MFTARAEGEADSVAFLSFHKVSSFLLEDSSLEMSLRNARIPPPHLIFLQSLPRALVIEAQEWWDGTVNNGKVAVLVLDFDKVKLRAGQ